MPRETRVSRPEVGQVDFRVARLAAGSGACVDLDDLRACGLSRRRDLVAGRARPAPPPLPGCLRRGSPQPLTEGPLPRGRQGLWPRRRPLHFAAAFLWGMLEPFTRYPDVTAPTPTKHPRINTHQSQNIDATTLHGIPVTTPDADPHPPLLDAAVQDPPPSRQRSTQPQPHHARSNSSPRNHRGAKKLREVLATAAPTRYENENLVLAPPRRRRHRQATVNPAIPRSRKIPDFLLARPQPRSWKPTAAATTTHLIARADDADKQAELEALGYTRHPHLMGEMTTRPDRMLARVQRELTRVDPPAALVLRSA